MISARRKDEIAQKAELIMSETFQYIPDGYMPSLDPFQFRFDNLRQLVYKRKRTRVDKSQLAEIIKNEIARSSSVSFYTGFPWCVQKCTYCNLRMGFNPGIELQNDYINTLLKEMEMYKSLGVYNNHITSCYFGGGTPSILTPQNIQIIAEKTMEVTGIGENSVRTFEISPATINKDKLLVTSQYFNRASLGIQSTDTQVRQSLGRILNRESLLKRIEMVMKYHDLINVDLIYGVRGQTLGTFLDSIQDMINLGVHSITLYRAEFFKGTPDYDTAKTSPWSSFNETEVRKFYFAARILLADAGYQESPLGWFIKTDSSQATPDSVPSRWEEMVEHWKKIPMVIGSGQGAFSNSSGLWMENSQDLNTWKAEIESEKLPSIFSALLDDYDNFIIRIMRLIRSYQEIPYMSFISETPHIEDKIVPALRRLNSLNLVSLKETQGIFRLTPAGEVLVHWVILELINGVI